MVPQALSPLLPLWRKTPGETWSGRRLRRERKKWGAILDKEVHSTNLPQGLYTDGKRVPTLVRETTVTKVQVPDARRKAAYRTVTTTSNKLVVEDHYPVVAEPGGQYITHVTPENGTGLALAQEIVAVVKERKAKIRSGQFIISTHSHRPFNSGLLVWMAAQSILVLLMGP